MFFHEKYQNSGMIAHTYNPSTGETDAGGWVHIYNPSTEETEAGEWL